MPSDFQQPNKRKIIVFGNHAEAGTTYTTKRILGESPRDSYIHTKNATESTLNKDNFEYLIYDVGDHAYFNQYANQADLGVFCIDLTSKINKREIIAKIDEFHHTCSLARIVLVCTKYDLKNDSLPVELKNLHPLIVERILTSKETNGELFQSEILNTCNKYHEETSFFQQEKMQFLANIQKSPYFEKLKKEFETLEKNIGIHPEEAINLFTTNCSHIINGHYPNIKKAIASVAIAAAVTVVAGLVGFGIGFLAGIWTGPGAILTGLAAGTSAAVWAAGATSLAGGVALVSASVGFFAKAPDPTYIKTKDVANNLKEKFKPTESVQETRFTYYPKPIKQ